MSGPRYVSVGEVVRPHGVRGELRVRILTEYPERLHVHTHFYLAHPDSAELVHRYTVERIRLHRGVLLLKLEGCDDRNAAEALRGMLVQIPLEDAVPLEEGEYYLFQLLGVEVETEHGERLGRVVEVLETGANDVYVVRGPRGEVLVPAISEVVRQLDLAAKRMIIHLMPGLLGDEE
ncbi:MAG: ribosome maturation factor RimM [Anaerolineae bacterium]|nr:ribosome maturation factor RimM [Anaerolineae bacterium]